MIKQASHTKGVYCDQLPIEWNDCNAMGILSPSSILNFAQVAAGRHAENEGFGYTAMIRNEQAWVLQRIKISIFHLPAWRSEVQLETWIKDLKGSTSSREFLMMKNNRPVAKINTFWVCINYKKRKPEPPLVDLTSFPMYPQRIKDHPVANRIDIPKNRDLLDKITVKFSDLDLLQHANNTKYLNWVMDCMEASEIKMLSSATLEMNFLSELHLGDEVFIERGTDQYSNYYIISKVNDGSVAFVCKID